MRLYHIQPFAVEHQTSEHTKVFAQAQITSWLQQWSVGNNYGQTIIDLECTPASDDPFKQIADKFMSTYRSVIDAKAGDHVLDDFRFEFWIRPVVLCEDFWSMSGYRQAFSIRQLTQGVHVHVGASTIAERVPFIYKAFLATLPNSPMSMGEVVDKLIVYMEQHHQNHEPVGKYELLLDAMMDCNEEKLVADTKANK